LADEDDRVRHDEAFARPDDLPRIKPPKGERYYRYRDMIVCVVPDSTSEIGARLVVPNYGKVLRDLAISTKSFAPLPKQWRKYIAKLLQEREEAKN
jgi:hypothetical protein